MSYRPIIPSDGLVGWNFLQKTMQTQTNTFNKGTVITRDTAYFEANIGKIDTAEDLVNDRRLLRVALGAFGLQDDINNKFFVRKMLEEGSIDPDALSNRMTDSRYKAMVKAFGFGDFPTPNTKLSTFAADIIDKFRNRSFEVAVGEQNDNMRLALNVERELQEIASTNTSADAQWFTVMGSPPLRKVFESAFNLPSSFGQLDLDRQLELFKERASRFFGNEEVSQFSEPEAREKLVQRFFLMSQINQNPVGASSTSIALTLLQS